MHRSWRPEAIQHQAVTPMNARFVIVDFEKYRQKYCYFQSCPLGCGFDTVTLTGRAKGCMVATDSYRHVERVWKAPCVISTYKKEALSALPDRHPALKPRNCRPDCVPLATRSDRMALLAAFKTLAQRK